MKNLVNRFVREEEGQDLIEYSLLAALIAVACILAMNTLAGNINGIFAKIGPLETSAERTRVTSQESL
jgi:pilus assembly protein Flp/PilA